jgi:HAD superfamily hydrolase (TIGR01490 family)
MSGYLALFDMDRTLLDINSAALYVRWRRRHGLSTNLEVLQVGLWMLKYKFGLLDAPRVAEKAMQRFRGDREDELQLDCSRWYRAEVRSHISAEGRATVERHRAAGAVIAVVTSSTRYAASPLAQELDISHVICTQLEVDDAGLFTGRLVQPMCFGEGKAWLAEQWALSVGADISQAFFYTDSISDVPLLQAVSHPVAVNPDPLLLRLARKNAWRIENWADHQP